MIDSDLVQNRDGQPIVEACDVDLINNLLSRFSRLLDTRRFDEWAALFTEDGQFNDIAGRSAILAYIKNGQLARQPELKRRHVITNAEIEVTGSTATATSILLMYDWVPDAAAWTLVIGSYDDTLVRTVDGRWMFASRKLNRAQQD